MYSKPNLIFIPLFVIPIPAREYTANGSDMSFNPSLVVLDSAEIVVVKAKNTHNIALVFCIIMIPIFLRSDHDPRDQKDHQLLAHDWTVLVHENNGIVFLVLYGWL